MSDGQLTADDRRFALGIGLTNACNLSCAHCYRKTGSDALGAEDVLRAVLALPARAVNFGTGESALHPEFEAIVRALLERGVAVTMTTNGHSAAALPDDVLGRFADVEFSIDYPSQTEHDAARGPGNWGLIAEQMARCRALAVPITITSVMMSTNVDRLPDLARLAFERQALLRVNVYQSVQSDRFSLDYEQFWNGWRRLLEVTDLVACGEPIVRAVLGLQRAPGAGCGRETVRITPRGAVIACVYGEDAPLDIEDLRRLGPRIVDQEPFERLRHVPAACHDCPHVETCGGGCASRRALSGSLDQPDVYCPFVRGDVVELRASTLEGARVSPKASSACTTIVSGFRQELAG